MKHIYLYHTLLFLLLAIVPTSAQESSQYTIRLKSGSFTPEKNILPSQANARSLRLVPHGKRSFVIIQFETIPTENERHELRENGIELMDYIPNLAYTATIHGELNENALLKLRTRAVFQLDAEQKMQASLANGIIPAHAVTEEGTLDVWISYPRTFSFEEISDALYANNFKILSGQFKAYQILSLRIPRSQLKTLAGLPFIQYVQVSPAPDKPVNNKSTANARANVLNSNASAGRNLLGEGVVVGVGDDSNPLRHADLGNRIINRAPIEAGSHGMHVMGTLAGGGIVNERFTGFAPKATILAQEYSGIFANAAAYVKDYGMVITNNSYGGDVNTCETFGLYDFSSSILDQQAFQFPNLLQVFAAGNSGNSACSPFPTGFANVLNGYQTSKNVISVGSTSEIGIIASSSSRGPVHDGRIKPEITAQGVSVMSTIPVNAYGNGTGTSMASPAVAGGLALLYQRFRQLNQNTNPENGLMKALLCNGATDKGNEGPDYKYGFGWMNLVRSLKMLESFSYKNDSVSHQNSRFHTISVPANTAQLKVMLYWNDPAAAIFAEQNLVNDLDLSVSGPSNAITLPKLLDPLPAQVNNAASTGVDHINNMEQAVIDNPVAGTYTITIKGTSVVQNPRQEFFIVYDAIPVSTVLTYPIGKERLKAGDAMYVSWDAYGNPASTFTIQYSVNDGASWNNISVNLPASTREIAWTIPAGIATDKAQVKVIQNGAGMESVSEAFTIIGVPVVKLSTVQCEGYTAIEWLSVPGATDYEVMLLRGDEMVSAGTTSSLQYVFSGMFKDTLYWVSVRARLNGNPGRRGTAVSRKPDSGSCTGTMSDDDLKMDAILTPSSSGRLGTSTALTNAVTVKVRIKNLDDQDSGQSFTIGYFLNGNPVQSQIITPLILKGQTYDHTFTIPVNLAAIASYKLSVYLSKPGDAVTANDTLVSTVTQLPNDGVTLPFKDDIESVPEQTWNEAHAGLSGAGRYDFNASSDAGRIRTFLNTGIAYSGSKAFTLDANRFFSNGNINYLQATFNLSGYNVASSDVRLDFQYKNHGQESNSENKIWIRGKDTDPWITAYDLFANQNSPESGYKFARSIEISGLLDAQGKNLSSSFQVRWGQWGKILAADYAAGDGYTIDDIGLYVVQNDVQVLSINQATDAGCGLGAAEKITVKVRNSSGTDLSNIPVTFRLGNGTMANEIIPGIPKRTNIDYTFTTTANLSGYGYQNIEAWVAFPADDYKLNDTLVIKLYNAPVISSFPHLENFELNDGYWHAEGINSSWAYGTPSSKLVNGAASGSKAWKTNLAGSYNAREDSYLYSPCYQISGIPMPTLSFSVSLDLETCSPDPCDFIYVEYSGNGGAWTRLGAEGQGTNWYNQTDSDKGSWSLEEYTRWHVATIPLPAGLQNIKFRFVMHSDRFEQRNGIAIDDVHIYDLKNEIYNGTSMALPVAKNVSAGTNWIDFIKDGKLIASIHPSNQNMGATEVQAYINQSDVRYANEQYYHDRNFTIKSANMNLADSVRVRLYFLDSETDSLLYASNCMNCLKPFHAYSLGISKFSSNVKSTEDGTVTNNQGPGWTFLESSKVTKVPYDKGYYAEMKVKSFSEFWLSQQLIGSNTGLPVELILFTANRVSEDNVLLSWETMSETDFDHFEIEVAAGNEAYRQNQFRVLGLQTGKSNSKSGQRYAFTDPEQSKAGVRYYRLKMVNADGTFDYSSVKPVVFDEKIRWHVYPNPSTGIFNIVFQAEKQQEVQVKVSDITGKVILKTQLPATGFVQKHPVDLSGASFRKGLYFLEIQTGTEKQVFKVLRE